VASELTVVKVGGSLYDLPDFVLRLSLWLDRVAGGVLLVPGGGPTAEVVRDLDLRHGLGEGCAHWLALRALSLNAHFLALLLAGHVVADWRAALLPRRRLLILDALDFAVADEQRPDHLPHAWDVTSDSVAARVAVVSGARTLVLLKSVTIPPGMSWAEASQLGFVDVMFPRLIERAGPGLRVEAVNFREWRP
jgi:aspartokinase-like uncharacterized kinase